MENQASVKRLPLETLRKRKGFSAHKLAQAAHVSIATVRAIELGTLKRAPRYETMSAIAQVLAVDPRDIDWPGNPYALDN
jgi:transcriptional regulator with XRE-family HTH domain